MKTQKQRILAEFQKKGFISNIWAVRNYILRLGARINELREEGYDIEGAFEVKKGKKTKNFVYRLK